ncbi:uncharacterized protein LOC141632486 [Silene latifolia]|uniref:uncharacterized protein LOC141632486 n=1 Tax=Silene latifolia TaxID=37657 RepID=UPI003D77608F
MGAMLAQIQHGQEKAICYLSKKILEYETNYSPIEKSYLALVCATKKLRHYMLTHIIHVISRMNPLKYLLEKPILSGRIARWTMMLAEFDLTFIAHKAIKGNAISDYLADFPISKDTSESYDFLDEEIFVTDDDYWQLFFNGASNPRGYGIGILLISPNGAHVGNIDALAKLALIINIPNELENIPLCIERREEPAYCMALDDTAAGDDARWFTDVLNYHLGRGFPPNSDVRTHCVIKRFAAQFILSQGKLYKKSQQGVSLLCVDEKEAQRIMEEVHNVEVANKNVKTIIEKMTEKYHDWPTKLPFALWGYRTSVRTPTGATPYSLVYGMEVVLPIELEIPSLRIALESQIPEVDWVQDRYEELLLIDEKRLAALNQV